jgi:hypothetical protein
MDSGLLSVLIAGVKGIADFFGLRRDQQQTRRADLITLRAELYEVRNEYLRFSRSSGTDANEHSRIISKAQSICLRACLYNEKCPQECLDVHTETDADRDTFVQTNEECKYKLEYVARKRMTPNQVTQDDNPLEYQVWGGYERRNEEAFDDAIKLLDDKIRAK